MASLVASSSARRRGGGGEGIREIRKRRRRRVNVNVAINNDRFLFVATVQIGDGRLPLDGSLLTTRSSDVSSLLVAATEQRRGFVRLASRLVVPPFAARAAPRLLREHRHREDDEHQAETDPRHAGEGDPRLIVPDLGPGEPGAVRGQRALPCLLYTSPSPRDATLSRMPSSA